MNFLEPALFLTSSAITFVLIYYKVPVNYINASLVLLLIIAIYTSTKSNSTNFLVKKISLYAIVFTSSLFSQIFVISSGGFYSPFLIILYLYSLTSSFLLNLSSSIVFLVSSFVILVLNTTFNPAVFAKFKEDPFTLILYAISFIVIIPLAQVVNKTYHVKEKASEKLKDLLDVGSSREESILRSLQEMVVVTDPNLIVLSANEAFEQNLKLTPGDYQKKPIFEVLDLQDSLGNKATRASLYIDTLLRDRATRIVEGFFIKTKLRPQGTKINVHLRPIKDSKDNITQIVFILTEKNLVKTTEIHEDLVKLRTSNQILYSQIKSSLIKANIPNLELQLELLAKHQEDLNTAQEIEDHTIKDFKQLKDLALLCKEIVDAKQDFAKKFEVSLLFKLPESEASELAALSMAKSDSPFMENIIPEFALPFDIKWVTVMLNKLIELCIMLSSDQQDPQVSLLISKKDHLITVNLFTKSRDLGIDFSVLFKPYYNHLTASTNLKYSSGLEGYIAKTISTQLNHPIEVNYNTTSNQLSLNISFTK